MPCETVNIGGATAIICSRGGRRVRCWKCSKPSEFQCDYPVEFYKTGAKKGKKKKDCDRHLCKDHNRPGKTEGVDFCEEHYPLALAAYERRMAKNGTEQTN